MTDILERGARRVATAQGDVAVFRGTGDGQVPRPGRPLPAQAAVR
ncbi:hypothetical protein ACRAWD_15425 [Caulobacter segnis]